MPPPPQSTLDPEQREFMEMVRARQMELPPDMRQKVQKLVKKEGAKATKDLHSAVRNLGVARSELEEALQARSNLIASWKTFLTDSIKTWQEYTALFPKSRARFAGTNTEGAGELRAGEDTGCALARGGWEDPYDRDQGRRGGAHGRTSQCGPLLGTDSCGIDEPVGVLTATSRSSRRHRDRGKGDQESSNRIARPQHGGRHGQTGRTWFQAVFCLARLCMTFTYDGQGLCRHWGSSTPAICMKWNNRAVCREGFVSEWHARAQALDLAAELNDSVTSSSSARSSLGAEDEGRLRRASIPKKTNLHVGFADDVDLWIGLEDCLQMFPARVPLDTMACGLTPWSCPTFEDPSSSPRIHAAVATPQEREGIPTQQTLHHSDWAADIWDLLTHFGITEDEEEGPVIFVNSFYIDHDRLPHSEEVRPLRFDSDFSAWERDIRFIWEDQVDPDAPLHVALVRPEPPRSAFPGTVATVIVHQSPFADRKAGLTTAVYVTDPTTRFHDRAHSLDPICMPADILRLSGAEETCVRREQDGYGSCTVHHQLPPLHPQVPVQTFHGQGFHVRVPPPLRLAEAEENLESRLIREELSRRPDREEPAPERTALEENPEDTSSFMARSQALWFRQAQRERDAAPRSSTSGSSMSTSSSESSTLDQRQTVLVLLNGRTVSTPLPWNRPAELQASAAQACDIRADQIQNLHFVPHRPADLQQAELECLLVQTTEDFPISHFLRLVLVDIEFYGTEELQPFAFRRLAKWFPHIINRRSVFRMVELEDQYEAHFDRCHLWHNHRQVSPTEAIPMRLSDGDYLKLYIGDFPDISSCTSSSQSSVTNRTANQTNISWHPDEHDNETFSTFQISTLASSIEPSPIALRVQASDVRALGFQDAGESQRPPAAIRGQVRFHPDDVARFHRLFAARAFVECEEEGPVAYVDTWYIHHQQHQVCPESRAIKLHHDSPNWLEDLVEPWAAEFDPTEDAIVHLVQPQPPCTLAECVLAHLIIEQSHRPQHGVGLLSKSGYDRANRGSNVIVHRAFSLPNLMNAALILRYIDLYDTCMNQFCRIRRGQLPFNMFEWEELPRACCLTTYYDRSMAVQSVDAPEFDTVELLQRFSPSTCLPQAGIDLTPPAAQCERFQFNPNAPAFVPNAPTAPQPPARWLELHQHWTRLAFSWEGEASSAIFLTWFVDQHNPALRRCEQPRRVSLTEDFRRWDDALRQAWPDRAISGAPFNIHVVAPQPPSSTAEGIVHVLLVQNPQDGLSTTLITAYDHVRDPEKTLTFSSPSPPMLNFCWITSFLDLASHVDAYLLEDPCNAKHGMIRPPYFLGGQFG